MHSVSAIPRERSQSDLHWRFSVGTVQRLGRPLSHCGVRLDGVQVAQCICRPALLPFLSHDWHPETHTGRISGLRETAAEDRGRQPGDRPLRTPMFCPKDRRRSRPAKTFTSKSGLLAVPTVQRNTES